MATLSQIRQQVLDLLRETTSDTHFSSTQLNSFINQALKFAAVILEHPRDFVDVQADSTADTYNLPSDFLLARTVYFGDTSIARDVRPIDIISEETLKDLYPNWLDQTSGTRGTPSYFIVVDKTTFMIYPKPDSSNAATGKKIHMNYVYVPTSMASDSDTPDLPLPYHDLLKFYATSLCYDNLGDPVKSKAMMDKFATHHKMVESASIKETSGGRYFQWGYDEDVNDDIPTGGLIIP